MILTENNIVIYDFKNDNSIVFLSNLFDDFQSVCENHLYDRSKSKSAINKAIRSADRVYMLGHGFKTGLFTKPKKYKEYDRHLISSENVNFLREKECVGIWCYAKDFAEKYGLKGLFTGMMISEQIESDSIFGEIPSKAELDMYNELFVKNVKYCLENYELRDIPAKMKELCPDSHPINIFNYENFYYYD